MNKSTHFELNLVEGTDLVNPLVQDVPNYQIIDEQMYKNQNTGVGGAVEIKTGTVHAINRLVPDCPMFRFTATSDYNVGDTFTVDGVQVSAKLSNGENLSDRCYVTNAEVIGVLVGTLITFFIPDVGVAKDSERLGGELPVYYAKKTEVDQAQLLAESSADLAQNNQNSINKLNGDMQDIQNFNKNEEVLIGYNGTTPVYRKMFFGSLDTWEPTGGFTARYIDIGVVPARVLGLSVHTDLGYDLTNYHEPASGTLQTYFIRVKDNQLMFNSVANWTGFSYSGIIYYTKN